jgi:hypothetical protein
MRDKIALIMTMRSLGLFQQLRYYLMHNLNKCSAYYKASSLVRCKLMIVMPTILHELRGMRERLEGGILRALNRLIFRHSLWPLMLQPRIHAITRYNDNSVMTIKQFCTAHIVTTSSDCISDVHIARAGCTFFVASHFYHF